MSLPESLLARCRRIEQLSSAQGQLGAAEAMATIAEFVGLLPSLAEVDITQPAWAITFGLLNSQLTDPPHFQAFEHFCQTLITHFSQRPAQLIFSLN
jgi:hypothetical protein